MKTLEQLIQDLCPNGVNYRQLKYISVMKRGTSATKKTMGDGNIPVISGGMQPAYYCDRSNRDNAVVTVAGSGASAGYVMFWDPPVFVCDAFSVQGIENLTDTKFLYYLLKNAEERIQSTQKGGGVPHVHISNIESFEFPVPPMPVQLKIVEILDSFTALTAELQAELQARQQQYEYYRDRLLSFGGLNNIHSNDTDTDNRAAHGSADERNINTPPHYKLLIMRSLGKFYSGLTGKSKSDFKNGNETLISYMNIYSNISLKTDVEDRVTIKQGERQNTIKYGDIIFTGSSETKEDVGMTSVLTHHEVDSLYLNSFCFGFRLNDLSMFNPEFMKHLFRCKYMRKQIIKTANGVTRYNISKKDLGNILVPIVSLTEQERIADILDRFETLTNDLTSGIPAEIAARQQQYEYYRDKLLNFKRISV